MDETQQPALEQSSGSNLTPDTTAEPVIEGPSPRALARRIEEAPTIPQKAQMLWALPTNERHAALGELNVEIIAAIIEDQPDENTALLGNLPAPKFNQLANLGPPEQGRLWLERAVMSGHLAAQMLPALMQPRDLTYMLMTGPEMRRILPKLLNFNRAEDMRSLLHPLEWKTSLDDLLLADAQELLHRAPIKNRAFKAVLQSLLDFYPEAYLETIRLSMDRAKYEEDRPDELYELTQSPFALPEFLREETVTHSEGEAPVKSEEPRRSLTEIVPAAADPFLSLATTQLPEARRTFLEDELRALLRQEVVSAGSFAQADLMRAASRLLFQLRSGLEQAGGDTPDKAAQILLTRTFTEIAQQGSRVAERLRQRALQLSGVKDWLDSRQKQFLTAMKTPEPGMEQDTNAPVMYLSARANQPREEWMPTPLADIEAQLDNIASWAGLARAAFNNAARVQTIFATAKTKTAEEAARRTVVALCLYRRWEPELVRPGEDYGAFQRQFTDSLGRLNPARQVVLEALDATPVGSWKPADAKEKARTYLLRAVSELEKSKMPDR